MKVCMPLGLCLAAGLLPQAAHSQLPAASTSSPAAFVFVSTGSAIYSYSAAANGKLTAAPGSPLKGGSAYLATNGKYLFGLNFNGANIDSFAIAANGSLKKVSTISAVKYNLDGCGSPLTLFLDHTGSTLYDLDFYNDCANSAFQFFSIAKATGQLTYHGVTSSSSPAFQGTLSFIGNNTFAYGSTGYRFSSNIYAFKRSSNGDLTDAGINPETPVAASGSFYLPYLAAADPANHVAIPLQPVSDSTLNPTGPFQLATYTASSSGNLTSNSTRPNMPAVAVKNLNVVNMAPSGKLLAVGGSGGLQVFHFNGSSPITKYTGLLTTSNISQIFWDNANHLYAMSSSAGKLFVFTVTPTGVSQATGSPYAIHGLQTLSVLPK